MNIFKLEGQTFKQIAGSLTSIAVGSNETLVWGLNGNQIYKLDFFGTGFQLVEGELTSIAAGAAGVWGINSAGWIYRYAGYKWDRIPGTLNQISVGGSVWGLNSASEIYRFNGYSWDRTPGPLLKRIAVGSPPGETTVWGLDGAGQIYTVVDNKWVHQNGVLTNIAVGTTGVWGVNSAGELYRFNGADWDPMRSGVKAFAVGNSLWGTGSEAAWALDSDGQIFAYLYPGAFGTGGWTQFPGALQSIAVGGMGVWGLG
jgi:virginiamycin B lyase